MSAAERAYSWERSVRSGRWGPALVGYLALAAMMGGFGLWAVTAPISAAAIAPGIIAAAGRNVTIQSLDSGIITAIHVREGDWVETGNVLVTLDDTIARSEFTRLQLRALTLGAVEARLTAERDGLQDMPVIPWVDDEESRTIALDQQKEFAARLERYRSERAILRQRQTALEQGLAGLNAQQVAIEEQLAIVDEELAGKQRLLDQGLTNRFEFTQIQRSKAGLIGQLGVVRSQIAASKVQMTFPLG